MKKLFSIILLAITARLQAQDTIINVKLVISGYGGLYYGLNKQADHNRPPFVYSYNRYNEANLNPGCIKAAYTNKNVRADLAFIAVTYPNANLAAVPAGGLQLTCKPSANVKINYSNYPGSEGMDTVDVKRFYNNFYGIFQLSKNFGITPGFDYDLQQKFTTYLSTISKGVAL